MFTCIAFSKITIIIISCDNAESMFIMSRIIGSITHLPAGPSQNAGRCSHFQLGMGDLTTETHLEVALTNQTYTCTRCKKWESEMYPGRWVIFCPLKPRILSSLPLLEPLLQLLIDSYKKTNSV